MATVKMKKGSMYADIYDSPETIKQAQTEGFSLVEEKARTEQKATEPKASARKPAK